MRFFYLKLNEEFDFRWLLIEVFIELSLTPSVYENFQGVLLFLKSKLIKIENKILTFFGLIKKKI